ncbi:MAG TPA: DUF433 domain-containing protein [Dehalococcoidia bacterium]|nr:DUF433 domain-containing protein [Dehalococcoidia bacterium]
MVAKAQRHDRERIVEDPAILAGKPVVRGTRIPVGVVLDYLANNPNFNDLFADYPRLTMEDVKACLAFARALVEDATRTEGGQGLPAAASGL